MLCARIGLGGYYGLGWSLAPSGNTLWRVATCLEMHRNLKRKLMSVMYGFLRASLAMGFGAGLLSVLVALALDAVDQWVCSWS
jgi:hypothetical protein